MVQIIVSDVVHHITQQATSKQRRGSGRSRYKFNQVPELVAAIHDKRKNSSNKTVITLLEEQGFTKFISRPIPKSKLLIRITMTSKPGPFNYQVAHLSLLYEKNGQSKKESTVCIQCTQIRPRSKLPILGQSSNTISVSDGQLGSCLIVSSLVAIGNERYYL